jgi:DNA-binding MarR family transcriptional regulator
MAFTDIQQSPRTSAVPARSDRREAASMPVDVPALQLGLDMAGFRLMKLTNLMSRPFFGQFAKQHAVSLNEWRCIVVLSHRPGCAAQDLSVATGLLPMNISRAVIALRKAGLVEEARDPENHRRVLLWLTRSGHDLFELIAPKADAQSKSLFSVLSEKELAMFVQYLDRLTVQAEIIASQDA